MSWYDRDLEDERAEMQRQERLRQEREEEMYADQMMQEQYERSYRESQRQHELQLALEEEARQDYLWNRVKQLTSCMGSLIYKLMSYKETFEAWLATRPEKIQELARKYPPGTYTIKEDAPYTITNPGSKVLLISYLESGFVGVIIKAEDKTQAAIDHEAMLCERYKKSKEEQEEIHKSDITTHVDPQYLELVHNELES